MPVSGRIRRRLALAIVLTALIPVLVAVWLAETAVRQAVARFYVPEIRLHLDRSLGLYQELARTVKSTRSVPMIRRIPNFNALVHRTMRPHPSHPALEVMLMPLHLLQR